MGHIFENFANLLNVVFQSIVKIMRNSIGIGEETVIFTSGSKRQLFCSFSQKKIENFTYAKFRELRKKSFFSRE